MTYSRNWKNLNARQKYLDWRRLDIADIFRNKFQTKNHNKYFRKSKHTNFSSVPIFLEFLTLNINSEVKFISEEEGKPLVFKVDNRYILQNKGTLLSIRVNSVSYGQNLAFLSHLP